jgi:RNA polymerase sigma-70 factor, ECF subfamily
MEHVSEILLLQRIAHGDTQALSDFYDRFSRLAFGIALQVLQNAAEAEEVTQDIFIQVWSKAATFDAAQGRVLTWFSSIARHRAIDQLRRRKVRPEGHSIGWEECCQDRSEGQGSLEPGLISSQQRETVRAALFDLPPEQREALSLAYFQGLSQQEIADRLEQPLGTVKTRIRLGMLKLRVVLSSLLDQPE